MRGEFGRRWEEKRCAVTCNRVVHKDSGTKYGEENSQVHRHTMGKSRVELNLLYYLGAVSNGESGENK